MGMNMMCQVGISKKLNFGYCVLLEQDCEVWESCSDCPLISPEQRLWVIDTEENARPKGKINNNSVIL